MTDRDYLLTVINIRLAEVKARRENWSTYEQSLNQELDRINKELSEINKESAKLNSQKDVEPKCIDIINSKLNMINIYFGNLEHNNSDFNKKNFTWNK